MNLLKVVQKNKRKDGKYYNKVEEQYVQHSNDNGDKNNKSNFMNSNGKQFQM